MPVRPQLALIPLSLLAILVFNTLAYMALSAARVTYSLFALQKLAASDWTVGLIMALFSVVAVPAAVPMGKLVDRLGARRPMTMGALMIAAGIFLPCWMPGIAALYFGSTIMGTGWLVTHIALLKIVGDCSTPENRLANFNAYTVSFSIAILIGPPSAGFLIDLLGHQATLGCLVSLVAIAAVPLAVGLRQLPAARGPAMTPVSGSAMGLLSSAALRPIYFVGSLIGSAWELYTFVVPIQGHHLGLNASTIGITLGAYSGATFLIRTVMPRLARRYTEWEIVRGALLSSTLGFALLPLVGGATSYIALSFVMGLALGSCLPNVLSLLQTHAPPGRNGEALGIRVTITNTIQVTVPVLVGALGASVGLAPVFWGFAGAMGAGLRTAHLKVRQGD